MDPQGKGTRLVGIVERVSFFVTGIGYATLAVGSLNLLLRKGNVSTVAGRTIWPRPCSHPSSGGGLVGLAGAAVVIAGILQMRLGVTAGFRQGLQRDLSPWLRRTTIVSGRLSQIALGPLSLLVRCHW